jgi:Raf kinase inhibitor-like YbhB/YbcL family protein
LSDRTAIDARRDAPASAYEATQPAKMEAIMALHVKSPAFNNGEQIPKRYSCDGEDMSPPLAWSEAPEDTRSFAIFCDDPDAPGGMFHHWAMYDIPKTTSEVPENFASAVTRSLVLQGKNDFGKLGYGGACPPKGHGPHHYHFKVMALDCGHLDTHGKSEAAEIEAVAQQHCIAEGELVGIYSR